MLYFKDVPVVIEPGVAALEVAVCSKTDAVERVFFVPFGRVTPNSTNAEQLPVIVSSAYPHIFTMHADLNVSPFLLVYDTVGKLAIVYSRHLESNVWVRNNTAPEQVGDTVTQFSVRFPFKSAEKRNQFLSVLDCVISGYARNDKISRKKVALLLDLVMDSDSGFVVLPVAVAKAKNATT